MDSPKGHLAILSLLNPQETGSLRVVQEKDLYAGSNYDAKAGNTTIREGAHYKVNRKKQATKGCVKCLVL